MKKIGCFVGKFLPPHIGHLSVIDRVINECEKAVIVLSEDPKRSKEKCEKSSFPYFTPMQRLEWLKKHYQGNNNIKFVFLDESGLKSFPEGLEEWSKRFKEVIKDQITAKYADESYRQLNELYFPECEFVAIDRDAIAVHGTDIRNKKEYLKYVIPEGYDDIKKQLDKQFNRQMDKRLNKQLDKQTTKQINRQFEKQIKNQTKKQNDKEIEL